MKTQSLVVDSEGFITRTLPSVLEQKVTIPRNESECRKDKEKVVAEVA